MHVYNGAHQNNRYSNGECVGFYLNHQSAGAWFYVENKTPNQYSIKQSATAHSLPAATQFRSLAANYGFVCPNDAFN